MHLGLVLAHKEAAICSLKAKDVRLGSERCDMADQPAVFTASLTLDAEVNWLGHVVLARSDLSFDQSWSSSPDYEKLRAHGYPLVELLLQLPNIETVCLSPVNRKIIGFFRTQTTEPRSTLAALEAEFKAIIFHYGKGLQPNPTPDKEKTS